MTAADVITAYLCGVFTVIAALGIRDIWQLRDERVRLPRMTARRLARQLTASGAISGNRRRRV